MIHLLIVLYNHQVKLKKINENISNYFSWIIFDNSTDKSIQNFNKTFCENNNITYCTFNENVGIAKAYNHVIKNYLKKDDYLIVLDDDTEISDDYFDKVIKCSKNNEYLSYMAIFRYGKNRYGPKIISNADKYKAHSLKTKQDVNGYLLGINSCSLFSAKLFDKVGLFDERLMLDYVDVDFCLRLAKNNIKSKTINADLVQHFFSKEKSTYQKVKIRLDIQKRDARIFYSNKYLKGYCRRKLLYARDMLKFILLNSLSNNIFWFLPLLFSKNKRGKIWRSS